MVRSSLKAWLPLACLPFILLGGVGRGSAQDISVGPRGGVQASVIRFQDQNANEQTEMKLGVHLGVSGALLLRQHLETEVSLLVAQGGFEGRGGHPANMNTLHIELPVLIRIRMPWRISPHLTGGLSTRFRVGCNLSEVGIVGETTCDDPVVGRSWKKAEVAGIAGAGLGFAVGKGFLLAEGTLNWGLSDLSRDPLPPGWAKTADLRFSTALRFPVR